MVISIVLELAVPFVFSMFNGPLVVGLGLGFFEPAHDDLGQELALFGVGLDKAQWGGALRQRGCRLLWH